MGRDRGGPVTDGPSDRLATISRGPPSLAIDGRPRITIPAGVRDMLPQEMAELADVIGPFRTELEAAGYGEVHTPALEFESVMALGDVESTQPAFRLFDEEGRTLVLRSDMTIPVARLVATRLKGEPTPIRLYYVSHVYRGQPSRPGHPREFLQLGAELFGRSGTAGTLELLELVARGMAMIQLERYTILLGDTTLFRDLLKNLEVPAPWGDQLLEALLGRNLARFTAVLTSAREAGEVSGSAAEIVRRAAYTRGGIELFDDANKRAFPQLFEVAERLERLMEAAETSELRGRVRLDFALVRKLGYYTGEVFEIHHPQLGEPLGGGGRYDGLLERFGRRLPAVGFGMTVERMHEALRADDDLLKQELRGSGPAT